MFAITSLWISWHTENLSLFSMSCRFGYFCLSSAWASCSTCFVCSRWSQNYWAFSLPANLDGTWWSAEMVVPLGQVGIPSSPLVWSHFGNTDRIACSLAEYGRTSCFTADERHFLICVWNAWQVTMGCIEVPFWCREIHHSKSKFLNGVI